MEPLWLDNHADNQQFLEKLLKTSKVKLVKLLLHIAILIMCLQLLTDNLKNYFITLLVKLM